MSSLNDYLLQVIPFIFISIPFVLMHRILEIKKRQYGGIKTTKYREVGTIVLMYSLIFIGIITIGVSIWFINLQFLSEHIQESIKSINIIPFIGILGILSEGAVRGLVNILGNVFMFMPLGFCVALLSPKEKMTKYTVLTGAGVSLTVEIIQVFAIRSMDINDIILNTLGAFLGLKLLNLLEKHFYNFFSRFDMTKIGKVLTLKEKRKIYIINVLQVVIWVIMIVKLKQMVMVFGRIFPL